MVANPAHSGRTFLLWWKAFVDQRRQTSGSAEDGEDETPAVPREIERAIRNMTGARPTTV